jgi:lysophospholipase L1-like esterase
VISNELHNYIEKEIPMIRKFFGTAAATLILFSSFAHAENPLTFSNNTRYLAMGDSLATGFGAIPMTQGYAYLLYHEGTFDKVTNTIFANVGMPGATSANVFDFQVPEAVGIFRPDVVTISVGGNDLLQVLKGVGPGIVLPAFEDNLLKILGTLRIGLPNALIIIGNQYDIPEITASIPGGAQFIDALNKIIARVAGVTNVRVADVFHAFQGRKGLLLVERRRAEPFEVHPTNAGYRVMANAFAAAAQ